MEWARTFSVLPRMWGVAIRDRFRKVFSLVDPAAPEYYLLGLHTPTMPKFETKFA